MQVSTQNSATTITLQDCLNEADAAQSFALRAQKIQHQHAGQYLSSQRGRGMEFDELRLYQSGDDIRSIDWNVTARTGKTHTKLYREERERPVLFWLDLRAPMFFATRVAFKSVIATKIAALLAWVSYRQGDKIGGLIFSEQGHCERRPKGGRNGLMQWLHEMSQHRAWQEDKQHDLQTAQRHWQTALQRLAAVARSGNQIFMLSDFFDLQDQDHALLNKIAKHNEIHWLQITDPLERSLPKAGDVHVQTANQIITLHTQAKKNRLQYQSQYTQRQNSLDTLCRRLHINHLQISTHDNYRQKLMAIYQRQR